ncbi:hypothetical protein N8603_03880 [Verrucomicrobiales bacterium]|nr:hypothetical protein [Verrucomicrobiales bacterium]
MKALENMPADNQTLFLYHFEKGLFHSEIAKVTGLSCLELLLSQSVRFFRYIIFELSVLLIYELPFLYDLNDPSILQQQKLRSDVLDFQNFDCKK